MKRFTAFLFVFLLAIPAFAREARPKLKRVPAGTVKVERVSNPREKALRLIGQLRQPQQKRGPGTEAVIINRSARALVIPTAGNVRGQGGTHFKSDVTLANWNEADQIVGVMWLPNGNPEGLDLFVMMLEGQSIMTEEDFVGGFLDVEGLGSLIFLPLDAASDVDLDAAIDAYSRVWTPQPGSSGTVSQPFAAVEPSYMTNEEAGIILGLRQDAQFRTNYGILNLSGDDLTFELDIFAEAGQDPATRTVTVPSLSMILTSIPSGDFGPLSIGLSLPNAPLEEFTWLGFASSTDNTTGDGWVSLVANPYDDDRLDEIEEP